MFRVLFLLAIATPATAAAPDWAMATLGDGLAAHRAKDYARARSDFRRLAGEGSAIAETMLGVMHARGQGVPRDAATAATWWLRAANRGYPPAQFALAEAFAKGRGVGRDAKSAWLWARLAATHGDTPTAKRAGALAAALATRMDAATLARLDRERLAWRPWATSAE